MLNLTRNWPYYQRTWFFTFITSLCAYSVYILTNAHTK